MTAVSHYPVDRLVRPPRRNPSSEQERCRLPVKKRPLGRTRKLTHRQRRVLQLVVQGRRNQEIAAELGVTALSIRNDLGAIYKKIGVSTRIELTLWYWARQQEGTSLL